MIRHFTARPKNAVEASTDAENHNSYVLAIQFDIEIPYGVRSDEVIEFITDSVDNSTVVPNFHIISADVGGDVTTNYEDNYPDCFVYRDNS